MKFLKTLLILSALGFAASCYPYDEYDTSVENNVGRQYQRPYQDQQQYGGGAPYSQQGYQGQNPYPQQQQYQQQPYQQPYYPPQVAPGSRYYSNPYAFQPQPGANPYYDYDQYYVPPTRYRGNESFQKVNNSPF